MIHTERYKPDASMCCEACAFGSGAHATWCLSYNPPARCYPVDREEPAQVGFEMYARPITSLRRVGLLNRLKSTVGE